MTSYNPIFGVRSFLTRSHTPNTTEKPQQSVASDADSLSTNSIGGRASIAEASLPEPLGFAALAKKYANAGGPTLDTNTMPPSCRTAWFQTGAALTTIKDALRSQTNVGCAPTAAVSNAELKAPAIASLSMPPSKRDIAISATLIPMVRAATAVLANVGLFDQFTELRHPIQRALTKSAAKPESNNIWSGVARIGNALMTIINKPKIPFVADFIASDGLLQLVIAEVKNDGALSALVLDNISDVLVTKRREWCQRMYASTDISRIPIEQQEALFELYKTIPVPELTAYHLAVSAAQSYALNPELLPALKRLLNALNFDALGFTNEIIELGDRLRQEKKS